MIPYEHDPRLLELPPNEVGAFAILRSELTRKNTLITEFSEARPSSAAAYNALGGMIMEAYLDSVEEIGALGIPYHHNLGVALFCSLHTHACYHYYREYDRLQGLPESAVAPEMIRRKRSIKDLLAAARRRLPSATRSFRKNEWNVAFAGTTTFTWESLRSALALKDVALRRASTGQPLIFPRADLQSGVLRAWMHTIHDSVSTMLGVPPATISRYGPDPLGPLLSRIASTPALSDIPPDLLITGTLGNLATRVTALSAMGRGIPVLTFHHGAQSVIWDEPYFDLYEGSLPDFRVLYGDIDLQRQVGAATTPSNLRGGETRLFSRTDKTVQHFHSGAPVETLTSLKGKSVLYLASEFQTIRYGPFRDIHPSTYLGWQQKLLAWLETQTGMAPEVRLHPKRPSTHFDPQGYPLSHGDLIQAIERANVLVLDYPTTSLPIVIATTKPVLYFDLGIRRLFPAATQAIAVRCMTSATDVFDPSAAFTAIEASLGKICRDSFSGIFSVAPGSDDELSDSVKAITQALSIR
jgi:hypothetical protein